MFFAKITHDNAPKNRLQIYVKEQVQLLDSLTVEDPAALGEHLNHLVHRANGKFPRCGPLKSYLHKSHTGDGFTTGISDLVQISLYKQRGQFEALTASQPTTTSEGVQTSIF